MTTTTRTRSGVTLAAAINEGLAEALETDDNVMVIGEDVGRLGGVFRITAGLQDRFGADRIVDSPLAEAGLVGTAIGLALSGMRPVLEIQFDGFVYPAMNQIVTHLARMPARFKDPHLLPVTIRIPVGGRIRASEMHSESPETFLAHAPDLRVVAASTADTAKALLLAAIRSDEPFVFLEPKRLYRRNRIPEQDVVADVDPGRARRLRDGDDAVIVTYGPSIDLALDAATQLSEDGVEAAILDLVSLAPLDTETILDTVARSGRVVVVSEAPRRCSLASEVAAVIATEGWDDLRAAPRLVTSPSRPYPVADEEEEFFPSVQKVVDAVKELLK